jgi:transposase
VAEWEYLHFTPTYSSWLNHVELWFAKIERDVIARGVFFTSVPDLNRTLVRSSQFPQILPLRISGRLLV